MKYTQLLFIAFGALKCFESSQSLDLNDNQRIELCFGADSLLPVECYKQNQPRDLNDNQRVKLCNQAKAFSS